ncbi:MAG TPA: ribonuclease HI family protein [Verrucomicrobiae bacterium]|nr:ribonuclease HI family protein [Verrucomicrobiae bacterium]
MTQKSLFKDKDRDTAQPRGESGANAVIANIDGGARGNPGPAAYGVVIRNSEGKVVEELSEYLGLQTNNFAEYSGLLAALDYALREKVARLKVRSDSELLVRQMKGVYKVKNPALQELFARAQSLVRKLEHFSIEHVFREQNREADRLVNAVLDNRK